MSTSRSHLTSLSESERERVNKYTSTLMTSVASGALSLSLSLSLTLSLTLALCVSSAPTAAAPHGEPGRGAQGDKGAKGGKGAKGAKGTKGTKKGTKGASRPKPQRAGTAALDLQGAPALTPAALTQEWERVASAPALHSALRGLKVSWALRDLKTGHTYSARDAQTPTHPASNNKLATTAVAYDLLGPDLRYETRFWLAPTGAMGGAGVERAPDAPAPLEGALYWEASGDPKITKQALRGVARALKRAGLKRVRALVISDQNFTQVPLAPGYDARPDDDAAYRAAAGGVGYDFNRFSVKISPTSPGAPPAVTFSPPLPRFFQVHNAAKTIGEGEETLKVSTQETPSGGVKVSVEGEIPSVRGGAPLKGVSVARRAPNPLRFSGEALLWALRAAGVEVGEGAPISRGPLPPEAERQLLHSHTSPPLSDLLRDVNVYSNNFMAEQTLLTLGLLRGGFGGWAEGLKVAREHLSGPLGLKGFTYSNGSGLFGDTAFSAHQLTELLIKMHARSGGRFVELLPKSAAEGTLRARLKRLPRGAARAKTGTLEAVSTLCGHLSPRAGDPLVFCVLMSWVEGDAAAARAAQDALLERAWLLSLTPHP